MIQLFEKPSLSVPGAIACAFTKDWPISRVNRCCMRLLYLVLRGLRFLLFKSYWQRGESRAWCRSDLGTEANEGSEDFAAVSSAPSRPGAIPAFLIQIEWGFMRTDFSGTRRTPMGIPEHDRSGQATALLSASLAAIGVALGTISLALGPHALVAGFGIPDVHSDGDRSESADLARPELTLKSCDGRHRPGFMASGRPV